MADVGDQLPGHEDGNDADREVDDEDPPPAQRGEQPTDYGADRAGCCATHRPHSHAALDSIRWERRQDETDTGRDDHGGADRLHAPKPHKDPQVGAYRTGQARRGKNGQPEDKGGLASVLVGEAAGGDEERTEEEGVGVEHPSNVGERGLVVQTHADVVKGDVDDEKVEQSHHVAQGQRGQHDSGVAVLRLDRRGICQRISPWNS